MDGFHCSNMQLEQCQMVVCKFIAAVQYMHVLRQLRRGFCTIVLHYDLNLYPESNIYQILHQTLHMIYTYLHYIICVCSYTISVHDHHNYYGA